jgi:hypothetical protein
MRKLLLVGAALAGTTAAQANVTVHVERSPSKQAMLMPQASIEDFSSAQGTSFTSSFGGSPGNAVFTGFTAVNGAATLGAGQAVIKFDRGVRYFGYRPGALDENNTVELFSQGKSLGFFNFVDSPLKTGIVGASLAWSISNMLAGTSAAPSPFSYVNFFSDAAIDEVRFTQTSGTFSFDDVRVGDFEEVVRRSAVSSLSVQAFSHATAVPETSTWALMILGFGAVGFALRRRHRVKGVRFA